MEKFVAAIDRQLSPRGKLNKLRVELELLQALMAEIWPLLNSLDGEKQVPEIRTKICSLLGISDTELEYTIDQTIETSRAQVQKGVSKLMYGELAKSTSDAAKSDHYPGAPLFKLYWFILSLYSKKRQEAFEIYDSLPLLRRLFLLDIFRKDRGEKSEET